MEITEKYSSLSIFSCEKENSSAWWEMLSKPMKAQGEITAIFTICDRAEASGRKAGVIGKRTPKNAAAKQMMIPAEKRMARPAIRFAARFFFFAQRNPKKTIAAMERRVSPKYTSYPKSLYILPTRNTPPRKIRPNRGSDVAFAHSIAK